MKGQEAVTKEEEEKDEDGVDKKNENRKEEEQESREGVEEQKSREGVEEQESREGVEEQESREGVEEQASREGVEEAQGREEGKTDEKPASTNAGVSQPKGRIKHPMREFPTTLEGFGYTFKGGFDNNINIKYLSHFTNS